jgi:hypothetical protein
VYAATANGEVFSMHEISGERRWKYATGYPVMRTPAVIGERVFVTSDEPRLHCIDAKTGAGIWESPQVTQFASASAKRVYCVDDLGAFVVLDAASGALLGRQMPRHTSTHALVNDQTDRVYLISNEGVVQCFHEIGAKKPLYHRPKVESQPAADGQPAAAGATTPSAAPTESAEDAEEAEEPVEEAVPADEMEEAPVEDGEMEEDPFAEIGEQ